MAYQRLFGGVHPFRAVRIPSSLWDPAESKAAADGRTMNEVICQLLEGWLGDTYTEKYGVSYHLPICRDCDELCMTPFITETEYDAWRAGHEALGHTIENGPEVPIGGVYARKRPTDD